MTVPEIPDEALERAALSAFGTLTGYRFVQAAVTAAWPHMYAATLRHAADRLDPEVLMDEFGINPSAGGGNFVAASRALLRRMADEATP